MRKSSLRTGTWLLVADSEKALILENIGDAENLNFEPFRKEVQDNPPNREQAANKPGRFNDGPSVHRSAVADTDWHQLAKDQFAEDLGEILYREAHKHRFDQIILVAEPSVLGKLRKSLHKEVEEKVVGEIPKNLTNHPIEKMEKIIRAEVP